MNVLSLFAGIGGLELGLERAGMTIVGQVEIDPWCRAVLARHWPEVPKHDDVRTAVHWWLGKPRPPVDVVCGGFPCQPVSVAGKQRAQADERWLWPAAWAVIRDLRPRFAIMENVPGLLARGMGDVLGDLAAIGYDAEWDCVPAAAVGAPHLRDRVFIVARLEQPHGAVPDAGVDVVRVVGQRDGQQHGEPGPAIAGNHGAPWSVADATGNGRRPGRPGRPGRPARDGQDRPELASPRLAWIGTRPARAGGWSVEPDVGRVAHGVPRRVDRLRGLGNAVVPQVAEHIGRLVMEAA